MNNRQKWMLGGLALLVALWQGPGLVNQLVFAPVTSREEAIDKLKEGIDKKENERRRQRRAQKQLAELGKRSLPPDPVIAAQVFQNWLYESAASARLSSVVVDKPRADNIKRDSTYFVVHGQIKAQATLSQVCNLLYEFDKSGLLLKVASVRLEAPRRDPDPTLKVDISVDALALLSSPSRKTLWVGDEPPGPMPGAALAARDSFEPITMKNLFVRGYSGPPAPPAPPPTTTPAPPAAPSTAEFTYLVALVGRNGVYNATLFDRSSNKESVLRVGTEFKAGGYEGKVVEIAEALGHAAGGRRAVPAGAGKEHEADAEAAPGRGGPGNLTRQRLHSGMPPGDRAIARSGWSLRPLPKCRRRPPGPSQKSRLLTP